jgi:N-acyl-D-amino-acid deacylase
MDAVFRGATVVDGSGRPGFRADVGVAAGRVAEIGGRPSGRRVVDARGLVLAPGFIDMHSHSDLAVLADPAHTAKVAQGVTLEVLGQDGLSYAPADDATLGQLRTQLAGWNGDPPGFAWDWRSVREYLDRLDRGIAVNAAYLVPQGTLRMLHMGWQNRPPTPGELDAMRTTLARSLTEGAAGLSSGLTYAPGMYAGTGELTELCRVVAAHGGYYCPHHRGYGAGALDAYEEMIRVSRKSGCPLHLAHATMNFPPNRGRAGELLDLIDRSGLDLTLDTYPYLPGATSLSALLPSWAFEGGVEALRARLGEPAARERMRAALEEAGSDGAHGVPVDWSAIEVNGVRHPANAGHLGTIAGTARRTGRPAFDVFADLLLADDLGTSCLMHVGDEANVRAIMKHPAHTGGSDGLLTGDRPHPRAYGTFPRYLGHYVRECGVLGLEECVAHLTGRPARRLRLAGRGLVRAGYAADLVLFDPLTVADRATYDDPRRTPDGLPYVLVNGEFVIDDGRRTAALPGRSIFSGPGGRRR